MGVEELKLVTEALQQLGGEAKGAFIAWLVLCGLRALIAPTVALILATAAFHITRTVMYHVTLGGQVIKEYENMINRELGRTYDGCIYGRDKTTILATLRRGALDKEGK